jgi:hypothetical protein
VQLGKRGLFCSRRLDDEKQSQQQQRSFHVERKCTPRYLIPSFGQSASILILTSLLIFSIGGH